MTTASIFWMGRESEKSASIVPHELMVDGRFQAKLFFPKSTFRGAEMTITGSKEEINNLKELFEQARSHRKTSPTPYVELTQPWYQLFGIQVEKRVEGKTNRTLPYKFKIPIEELHHVKLQVNKRR